MKYIILIFLLVSTYVYSQDPRYSFYGIDFEDTEEYFRTTIDTIEGKSNVWQIGQPAKLFFSEANSGEKVISTDTLNTYPTNDSSIFIIEHLSQQGIKQYHTFNISGYYKVDCDSLNDYGKMEFSPNNGIDWIDLINDEIDSYYMEWDSDIPVLTGTSDWSYFRLDMAFIGFLLDIQDTVLFRFTFISDDIETHRDGLMFDDFYFNDEFEGIDDQYADKFKVTIYPNPCRSNLTFHYENKDNLPIILKVYDNVGKLIHNIEQTSGEEIILDVGSFTEGVYYYRIYNTQKSVSSNGMFIVY